MGSRISNILLLPFAFITFIFFVVLYPIIAYIIGRKWYKAINDALKSLDYLIDEGSIIYFKATYNILKKGN